MSELKLPLCIALAKPAEAKGLGTCKVDERMFVLVLAIASREMEMVEYIWNERGELWEHEEFLKVVNDMYVEGIPFSTVFGKTFKRLLLQMDTKDAMVLILKLT